MPKATLLAKWAKEVKRVKGGKIVFMTLKIAVGKISFDPLYRFRPFSRLLDQPIFDIIQISWSIR